MNTANKVIKNTGFLYAKMGITMFISLYTTRLVLNTLGVSDFGIFNIVGGAIAMLGFLDAAMASATQRFMSYSEGEGDKEKQKKIFNISITLHFLIALLAGIVLLIAGCFFFNGILNIPFERIFASKVVYGSLIVSTIFTVMTVPYDALLNAHENMFYYAIVGIIESLLKLSVALAVVHFAGDKLIIYGTLTACIPLISMIIMRIYCHKNYSECIIAPKRYWDKKLMKEMTSFAGWNLLGSMSSIVGNYGNGMVLNHFFGTLVNAAIGIAIQLTGQLSVFSTNLLKAVNPVIVKKEGGGNRKSMLQYSYTGSKMSFYLLAFLSIPSMIEAPFILKLWLIIVPDWSIIFFRFAIFRSLIEQITILFGTSLAASGSIKEFNIISSILNFIPIPVLILIFNSGLSPSWFYIVIIFFMVILPSIFKIYICKIKCNLSLIEFFTRLLLPCIFAIILGLLIGSLSIKLFTNNYIKLIVCLTSTSITLILYSFLFFDKEEKKVISIIINKLISYVK